MILLFLLFQGGFISFPSFGKKGLCIYLGRQMLISRVDWVRGQAISRKLSTAFVVLTRSRRSNLIASRLDLYMDLETVEVWEFTSGVLTIGLKAGKMKEKGLFSYWEKTRSRRIQLMKGMAGRNICLFTAQCHFRCTYMFCTCMASPMVLGP